nr:glutamate mutase L [Parvivirga hydrogeniphila]
MAEIGSTTTVLSAFADLREIDAVRPNLVLLAGGVEGGDADVVLFKAEQLAGLASRPVVVHAGNSAVAEEARGLLEAVGFRVRVTRNVYPAVDELDIVPARHVIHDAFEEHITHALRLERAEAVSLYKQFVNPSLCTLLGIIGFDRRFVAASGVTVTDDRGVEYLDFLGGYGALNLARISTGRTDFVYAENSFHGKSFGAPSVTGREKCREPFRPLVPDCHAVPFGDVAALERVLCSQLSTTVLRRTSWPPPRSWAVASCRLARTRRRTRARGHARGSRPHAAHAETLGCVRGARAATCPCRRGFARWRSDAPRVPSMPPRQRPWRLAPTRPVRYRTGAA